MRVVRLMTSSQTRREKQGARKKTRGDGRSSPSSTCATAMKRVMKKQTKNSSGKKDELRKKQEENIRKQMALGIETAAKEGQGEEEGQDHRDRMRR